VAASRSLIDPLLQFSSRPSRAQGGFQLTRLVKPPFGGHAAPNGRTGALSLCLKIVPQRASESRRGRRQATARFIAQNVAAAAVVVVTAAAANAVPFSLIINVEARPASATTGKRAPRWVNPSKPVGRSGAICWQHNCQAKQLARASWPLVPARGGG